MAGPNEKGFIMNHGTVQANVAILPMSAIFTAAMKSGDVLGLDGVDVGTVRCTGHELSRGYLWIRYETAQGHRIQWCSNPGFDWHDEPVCFQGWLEPVDREYDEPLRYYP